jgi:hypothetical protein
VARESEGEVAKALTRSSNALHQAAGRAIQEQSICERPLNVTKYSTTNIISGIATNLTTHQNKSIIAIGQIATAHSCDKTYAVDIGNDIAKKASWEGEIRPSICHCPYPTMYPQWNAGQCRQNCLDLVESLSRQRQPICSIRRHQSK